MANLTVTPLSVAPVHVIDQMTGPTGDVVAAGNVVYHDENGVWVLAQADSQANAGVIRGVSLTTSDPEGEAITVVLDGIVNVGDALDDLDPGDAVYLSAANAGLMADGAGASSTVIGYVVGNFGATEVQRLLKVVPNQAAGEVSGG